MFDEDDSGAIDLDNDDELAESEQLGAVTPEQKYDLDAIQLALKASRQMFGLVPPDDSEGQMPGFEEGGAVEDDTVMAQGGADDVQGDVGYDAIPLSDAPAVGTAEVAPGAYPDMGESAPAIELDETPRTSPDPETWQAKGPARWALDKVKAYLSGEGAAPPEKVDEAVQAAGSPEAAVTAAVKDGGPPAGAALVQGLRQRFDANRKQAIEAYGEGDFQNAATWATRMMHMAPNGEEVSFATTGDKFVAKTKEGTIALSPQEFTRLMRHSNFDHIMHDAQAIVRGRQSEEMKTAPLPQRRPAPGPAQVGPGYSHFRVPPELKELGVSDALYQAGMRRFPSVGESGKRMDWIMEQLQQGESNKIALEKARTPMEVQAVRGQQQLNVQNVKGQQQQGLQATKGAQQQAHQTQRDTAAADRLAQQLGFRDAASRRAAGVNMYKNLVAAGKRPEEITKLLAKEGLPSIRELQQPHQPQSGGAPGGGASQKRLPNGMIVERGADGKWYPVQ